MKDLVIHYSLFPAFQDSDDPIRDAILSGVKVTGVTITMEDKIVAQYPIFITNEMHYDNLRLYLEEVGAKLLALVKEKISNNEQFEVKDLMSSGCHNCGNCGGCGVSTLSGKGAERPEGGEGRISTRGTSVRNSGGEIS